ncbi:MAG TPA: EAL domain-containing protein [Noviherbaspirillum sp.]|nr:EAL domain-containing protein [Noviherbaspirillum sp.]
MNNKKALHVLIVEDSEDDTELLLDTLGGAFADIVHERVDCAAALRDALLRRRWDVVICDHGMPALDAPAALRIVQENCDDTPFIVVSGSMTEDTAIATMTAGAADMISKDHRSRLVPAIQREMRKASIVGDLRAARSHLQDMAYFDRMTGLPNRECLAEEVRRLAEGGAEMALMTVNINRFSQIMRTLGMEASEQALRQVGERIANGAGGADLVANLGGDRFAVLVSGADSAARAAALLGRLNEEVERPLDIAGHELFLTQRIGISVHPRDGRDFHTLLVNAEIAMNQARPGGAGNHRFFEPAMNAAEQTRLVLEHALHRALKQNEFVLHYQPQYDVQSGRMAGVEALLRWQPPGGARISPADFIPLLEETGLIVPVGEWVLRNACRQALEWRQAGHPPIRIAVNLSAMQFRQAGLVQTVQRVLAETGFDHRYLELEITENIALHNEEAVISTLQELRDLGISLAIDDFGTGYSSLRYLQRFPVHKLKIDRSFVKDIDGTQSAAPIIRSIVSLAHNLGLDVIAEGVETQQQAAFLRSCGCSDMQGYLFCVPLAGEEIARRSELWQLAARR